MLTRDAILSAEDLRTETVEVPEWGGEVIVREMTGADRDAYETSVVSASGGKVSVNAQNLRARLVAMSVFDEDGNRIFSEKDVKALGQKSARALDRIVDVATRLSGVGEPVDQVGED